MKLPPEISDALLLVFRQGFWLVIKAEVNEQKVREIEGNC